MKKKKQGAGRGTGEDAKLSFGFAHDVDGTRRKKAKRGDKHQSKKRCEEKE